MLAQKEDEKMNENKGEYLEKMVDYYSRMVSAAEKKIQDIAYRFVSEVYPGEVFNFEKDRTHGIKSESPEPQKDSEKSSSEHNAQKTTLS